MEQRGKQALQGLRGLACLHIVAFHYIANMTYGELDCGGTLQVPVFFLLSGFCLALRYGPHGPPALRTFLWRRLARLGPLYYAANLFTGLVSSSSFTFSYRVRITVCISLQSSQC
jgi:peptidoglycan/LPS O-acetylase OafA/YrhL